jgi:hypothetical protein
VFSQDECENFVVVEDFSITGGKVVPLNGLEIIEGCQWLGKPSVNHWFLGG